MKKRGKLLKEKMAKTFLTQPISQPDSQDKDTNMAIPDDVNVLKNKEWVDYNKK